MDAVVYDELTGFRGQVTGSMPGIRAMGLDVGATNASAVVNNVLRTNEVVYYQNGTELVNFIAGSSYGTGSVTEGATSIDFSITPSAVDIAYRIYVSPAVDLTGINKLYVDVGVVGAFGTFYMSASSAQSGRPSSDTKVVNRIYGGRSILQLDVSGLTGGQYIKMELAGGSTTATAIANVYAIWGGSVPVCVGNHFYLLKSLSRINLDRLTFPKIYKPANTKCQVDVCGTTPLIDSIPIGSVFGSHFDGNTTDFVGSVTPESNTGTFDTTNKKFGSASIAYNGSQFTQYADSTLWDVGSGDFYFDMQMRRTRSGVTEYVFGQSDSSVTGSATSVYAYFGAANALQMNVFVGSTQYYAVTTTTITDTNFHHIRCGRAGNNLYIAIDGIVSSAGTISGTVNNSSNKFCIGRAGEYVSNQFIGNIDEFVFVKGQPMNSTNYTVPTTPYLTPQAVGAQSITLPTTASATTDFYKDDVIVVASGTGAGQTRRITAYNGTTKVATLDQAWTTNPTTASGFALYDGITSAQNVSPGFDLQSIDYTAYPTINIICSLERLTGATASPSMGVPVVTSIEKDWVSQAPVVAQTSSTSYITALSATGRTKLDSISSVIQTAVSGNPIIRVTIDGNVVINDAPLGIGNIGVHGQTFIFNLVSASSMLIEVKGGTTNIMGIGISYSK